MKNQNDGKDIRSISKLTHFRVGVLRVFVVRPALERRKIVLLAALGYHEV